MANCANFLIVVMIPAKWTHYLIGYAGFHGFYALSMYNSHGHIPIMV